jgi:AbrB family looped-hinge helix DNA binding protein
MRTTIDRAGRLVVPKKLRDRLALGDGGDVDVIERDGVLEIHPVPAAVEVRPGKAGNGGPVAYPVDSLPPLTDADVREAVEGVRR